MAQYWLQIVAHFALPFNSQRPLDVGQAFNERAQVVSGMEFPPVLVGELWVELVGTCLALELCQIIQLPLACTLDPFAGQDVTGNDCLRILAGNGGVVICCQSSVSARYVRPRIEIDLGICGLRDART